MLPGSPVQPLEHGHTDIILNNIRELMVKQPQLTVGGCSGNCSLPLGGEFLNLGLSPGIRCNVEGGQGEAGGLHLASGH